MKYFFTTVVLLALLVTNSSAQANNDSTLIVFFSRAGQNWAMGDNGDIGWIDEGNTHVFARFIQEYTCYKTFEIVADTEWPTDYYEMVALGN